MRPWNEDMWWETCFLVFCLAVCLFLWMSATGCVGVDPSASMGDAIIAPALTAQQIKTAVVTAINSNASIVNDLWPLVAMAFIGVAGLVAMKKLNTRQTKEIKEHTENCTHS